MFCNRTPSSLILITVVFFCHESEEAWAVLSRPYQVNTINIHIYSLHLRHKFLFLLILASISSMDRPSFLSSGIPITLLGNWFLIYKLGRNFCNKWCVLKSQIFESQFLTLMWTVMATGLLGTARAKRTSKVQNNNITEEDITEQKR